MVFSAGWVADRIAQMRMIRGVSAREMSFDMGYSESFINKIENKKSVPSWESFFQICDYLQMAPKDFFDDGLENPPLINEVLQELRQLDKDSLNNILGIAKGLNKKRK